MANSVLTNTAASSAQRFVTNAGNMASSSISKLSSGSRIVKASDDASSLAISNKLRADISTLNQAGRNASQGASLLQVANGGLSQIGDLLTRMKSLSTQVVNGTLSSAERQFAQQEFGQLITQIGETANQTKVNGIAMLAGGDKNIAELDAVTVQGAAITSGASGLDANATTSNLFTNAANQIGSIRGTVEGKIEDVRVTSEGTQFKIEIDVGGQTFTGSLDHNADVATNPAAVVFTSTSNDHNKFTVNLDGTSTDIGNTDATIETDFEELFSLDIAGASAYIQSGAQTAAATYGDLNSTAAALSDAISTSGATKDGNYTLTSSFTAAANTPDGVEYVTLRLQHEDGTVYEAQIRDEDTANANSLVEAGSTKTVKFANGVETTFTATELNALASATTTNWLGGADGNAVRFEVSAGSSTNLSFQVGVDSTDLISIGFDSMTTSALGVAGLNIETVGNAQAASVAIDSAINKVNASTAEVGALQSRMEYVQSNLATVTENLEAANGIFRDVDMAKEMTEFTKQQTLMQAGISMLSQANQMPQLLLRLIG